MNSIRDIVCLKAVLILFTDKLFTDYLLFILASESDIPLDISLYPPSHQQ